MSVAAPAAAPSVAAPPGVNLFDLDRDALREYFTALAEQPFRAAQLMKWVYHRGVTDFAAMTDLGKRLRAELARRARAALPEIVSERVSADGTRKWLMRVDARNCIETVFIPEAGRGTLCVSSQVGCALRCDFCATGKQGFSRDLSVAEIIGQLWRANERLGGFRDRGRVISNVVMMGMGEPLLNFDKVCAAMALMTDDLAFGLADRRVVVSTAGVVPGIRRLAERGKAGLAVSLHAVNDALRDVLVPLNRKYPLADLLAACRRYSDALGGEAVTFEYVMLAGVNDSDADARALTRLLRGLPAKVNLIPFNRSPGCDYRCPPRQRIDAFREILTTAGIVAITRKTRGDDINAACGQLAGRVAPRAGNTPLPTLAG